MPSIFTVTLNPVIDLIYSVDRFEKGTTFRSGAYECAPAGKGINVSLSLAALGRPSIAFSIIGEDDVRLYERHCGERGVELRAASAPIVTRRHCTILESEGGVTHVQARGPAIEEAWVEELVDRLEDEVSHDDFVVLAGSLPQGLDDDIYARIIDRCRMKGGLAVVDVNGAALGHAARAHPFLLKINQVEAEELSGRVIAGPQDEFAMLQAVHRQSKIPNVAITLGARGAIAGCEEGVWHIEAPVDPADVKDTVGAGDAFTAGMLDAMAEAAPMEDVFCRGAAAAAACIQRVGPSSIRRAELDAALERVASRKIGEL